MRDSLAVCGCRPIGTLAPRSALLTRMRARASLYKPCFEGIEDRRRLESSKRLDRAVRGKYGKLRLGGPHALPEFSAPSWYAMLISAGMGIELMFWSVIEPVFHYMTPSPIFNVCPQIRPSRPRWPWGSPTFTGVYTHGIYALVGLSLAFFAYHRGLPLNDPIHFSPAIGGSNLRFLGQHSRCSVRDGDSFRTSHLARTRRQAGCSGTSLSVRSSDYDWLRPTPHRRNHSFCSAVDRHRPR